MSHDPKDALILSYLGLVVWRLMALGEWMEKEMREQPVRLRENCQGYWDQARSCLEGTKPKMVLLAARGSSDNAAVYARYLIEIHLGIPVCLAAPSVITKYGSKVQYPDCLAIGISQSGAAPDVSEVLAYMRSQGHATLAITNTPGSRLTQEASASVILEAGEERSIAATKTYTASLLALVQVIRALGADLPDPMEYLPDDDWVEKTNVLAAESSGILVRSAPIFALARGYGYCTALETALKLIECALLTAKSYSTADFEHGPKALADHGSACVVFGEVSPVLADAGTSVVVAPTANDTPYYPISNIIFGQWLALHAARARGLNPDEAQYLKKVTETL